MTSQIELPSGKTATVRGVEFDRISAFSDDATCAGFGSLVLCDLIRVEDMNEISEVLNDADANALHAALDRLAVIACRLWSEQRSDLNRFLESRRG